MNFTGVYTERVFHRVRRFVPAIAIVLLGWTAVDLANPECCLREQLTVHSASMNAAGVGQRPQPDFDDCFCCARCIDTGVRAPELRSEPAWIDFAEPAQSLAARPAALDHPPQNA